MKRTHKLEREFEATGPEMIALRILFNHLMEALQALDEEEAQTDHGERVDRGISLMLQEIAWREESNLTSQKIQARFDEATWQRFRAAEIARQDRAYIRRRISADVDSLIEWPTKLRRVKIA